MKNTNPAPAGSAEATPTAPTDAHIHGNYDYSKRWWALATLTFSLLAITTDMTILNVALPQMSADLQPTATQQLWILDAYSLVMAGMLVSMSSIADRWGRKKMLLLGYFIVALASFLVIFAETAGFVIGLRELLGFGAAMVMPSTLSLLRVTFTDPKERARALAVWAAVAGVGAAVGPLLGGFLLENFHWQSAFLVSVPMMLVALVGAIVTVPESTVPEPGPWDLLAAILSLVGMTGLVWGIKKFGESASLASVEAWIAFVIGAAAMAWFVIRCLRSKSPLIDVTLFTHRIFSAGVLAALVASFSMSAGLLLLAQWLQLVNGATAMESGIQLMPMAIAAAVTSGVATWAAGVIGMRATVFLGLIVSGSGMLYLGISSSGLQLADVLIALTLVGTGIGALALASSMIMGGVPRSKAGNAAAMEDTAYEFGAVLGIALLGSLSALMYRRELSTDAQLAALPAEARTAAEDSLGGAVAVAHEAGLPELARHAGAAFTEGLGVTGFIGGAIMVVAAFAVFLLTPKGTRFEDLEH